MAQIKKILAECGGFGLVYFSCGLPVSVRKYLKSNEYQKKLQKIEAKYRREQERWHKKWDIPFKYAIDNVLPECIKQFNTLKETKTKQKIIQVLNEIVNTPVNKEKWRTYSACLKGATNFAYKYNKERLGDKFLKILYAMETYYRSI